MKRTLVLLFTILSAAALAQTYKPYGVSLRGGLFFPTSGAARGEGRQWIALGLDYKLGDLKYAKVESNSSAYYGVSIDYSGKGDYSQVPITFSYIVNPGSPIYYRLGLGINLTQELKTGTNPRKESNLGFAYQVGAGYDFKTASLPVFVEVKYLGSSRSQLNGLGVYGGVRF